MSELNGILNINKPQWMTSFDVVASLRGILKIRKIGHAGTLDPMAAGVLPVCVGHATKAIEYMIANEKEYVCEMTLGVTTDTLDITGNVTDESPGNNKNLNDISDDDIINSILSFKGEYEQLPPQFSAKKINGKKAYEYARKGIKVELDKVRVRIIDISDIVISREIEENIRIPVIKVLFKVNCSKGTYIRSLCYDIGKRLGCGACMSALTRTHSGMFDIKDSVALEEVKNIIDAGGFTSSEKYKKLFIPVENMFLHFPKEVLNNEQRKMYLNGMSVDLKKSADNLAGNLFDKENRHENLARVYGENFIGIGEYRINNGSLYIKTKKFLSDEGIIWR